MAYTPNADEIDRPVNTDEVLIPEELRAIKAKLQTVDQNTVKMQFTKQKAYPSGTGEQVVTGNYTVNVTDATFHRLRITGNTTFTFTVPTLAIDEACSFTLRLRDAGNYTVTWPGTILWQNGIVPTLTEDGIDYILFVQPYQGAPLEASAVRYDMKVAGA